MVSIVFALLGMALFGLDQWVKAWTVDYFSAPEMPNLYATTDPPETLVPGVLEMTRVHNYGAAWSSFSGNRWLLVGVTAVVCLAVVYVLARRIVRHPLGRLAGALILSGGVGNILDRLRLGYVVDMLHFPFWPSYPTFNVADVCIVAGAVLGVIYYLWFYERYDRRGGTH